MLQKAITSCHSSPEDQEVLLQCLWESDSFLQQLSSGNLNAEPYLEYYYNQCHIFSTEQRTHFADASKPDFHLIETHKDILEVAQFLVTDAPTREDIPIDRVTSRESPSEATEEQPRTKMLLDNSINWAARLLTMMEIGAPCCAISSEQPLIWENGTLRSFIANQVSPGEPSGTSVRLQKIFNARNLELLCNIRIVWTSNLADHLRLKDDDKVLMIFQHATFLEHCQTDIFPAGFCKETLRTLSLLLPPSDKETVRWYKKQSEAWGLDPKTIHCPPLRVDDRQIERFYFWKERLIILKMVFDAAEPSTMAQWWYDKRKGPQWYTFWVAIVVLILTVFFGIVQSVEGALQVYAAYHPPSSEGN